MPHLALAVKSASFARIAETLVDTYLGRDAGRRVLQGHITRGVPEKLNAVLWFSDLEGYTRISDSAPPEQVIPLLNEYADAIVSAIHAQNGEVLKFIGDGVLAVFSKGSVEETCQQALAMVCRGGTAVMVGVVPIGVAVGIQMLDVVLSGKKIVGSMMGDNRFRIDMPRYCDFYLDGRLRLDEMISARIRLDEVNESFEKMKAGTVARSVIVFD